MNKNFSWLQGTYIKVVFSVIDIAKENDVWS